MEQAIGGVTRLRQLHVSDSAVVYSGHHGGLGIDVAVKVLLNESTDFVNRFDFEFERTKRLSLDPGFVTLHESGVTDAGRPYVISELCEGSIGSALESGFRFESDDACLLLASIARAVGTLHEAGVSHQQIRPSNLLLNYGRCLLSDVGPIGAGTSGQTASIGKSVGYVAPEIFEASKPGQPADVYSLGATLFHLVSGKVPFASSDKDPQLLSMLDRIAKAPVPDLRIRQVPDAVCLVIESAMRKVPTDRPSISELRSLLCTAAGVSDEASSSEWQASTHLIEVVRAQASAKQALAESNKEPDVDATGELDRPAFAPDSSKRHAVIDDPFLSVEEGAVSQSLPASNVDPGAVSKSNELATGNVGTSNAELEGKEPPPPAAFVPPALPGPDLSTTVEPAGPPPPQTIGVPSISNSDQSSVVGAPILPADRILAEAPRSGDSEASDDQNAMVQASGGPVIVPPPPTSDSLISIGNPPAGVGGSGSQAVDDLRRALGDAVATIKIKSSQYIAERQAKRASAANPASDTTAEKQPLSFSSDQLVGDPVQAPIAPAAAAGGQVSSSSVPIERKIDQVAATENHELTTSIAPSVESLESQASAAELPVDEPTVSPAPVIGPSVIHPLADGPVIESASVIRPTVDKPATSSAPAGEPTASFKTTNILPPADPVDDSSKVSLVITSNRIPLLDHGSNGSSGSVENGDGIRMLKPPAKRSASGSESGLAGLVANAKHYARIRTNDAVRKLQGQDGYYPAGSDERFSRNTLLLAGAAIVLFLAFSVVVAISFGGSEDEALVAIDPANSAVETSVADDDQADGSVVSGSTGDNNDNSSTSSFASKTQGEPTVLSSQVDRDQQLAVQSLNVKGIETEVVEEPSEEFDAGRVIRTEPQAGIELAPGQIVTLYVSTGPSGTIVRNVTGQPQADAVATLRAAGFQVEVVEESSESVEKGVVVRSIPAGGTRQPSGSRITLTVSSGTACSGSLVPEVVGLQLDQANEALGAANLSTAAQPVVDGGAAPGTVTSANPAAGQCAEPGTPISLSVSCQSITVPPQENFNVADARNVGFEVEVRQVDRGDLQPGQLVSVEPAFGTVACPQSRLVVTINRQCDFVSMPDTIGRGVSRANRQIQRQSLQPVYVEEFNADESRGDVIRTEPAAGAELCRGTQVTVYVSLGDPPDEDD